MRHLCNVCGGEFPDISGGMCDNCRDIIGKYKENILKGGIIPHLKDAIGECRGETDIKQVEHNLFEIADHLGIPNDELMEE